jgi:hypothetical protein
MSDFVRTLLTEPVALSWLLLTGACALLLVFACFIAGFIALIHAHSGESWRELLVTTTRVKISWIWGWAVACFALLLYVTSLTYLDRVGSWFAALPYLISAILTLGIAAWLRHSVRARVVKMQKLVQGGRP